MITLPLPGRKVVEVPENMRERRVRSGRSLVDIVLPPIVRQPMVVNYGYGTDSTAMLVLLVQMFEAGNMDAMPDRIMFADVGSEHLYTYQLIDTMQAYLKKHDFPEVMIVSRASRGTTKDKTLHASCERLQTMPSLAFGHKSCSAKHKADPMDYAHRRWLPAIHAWAVGMPVMKLIGYDGSPADMRRSKNPGDDQFAFSYPLRDAGLMRPQLKQIIADAGLPDFHKSSCWFCPAMKRVEIIDLFHKEPMNLAHALRIEAASMLQSARTGKKMTTKGLGRKWSWREFLINDAPDVWAAISSGFDVGTDTWNAYQAIINASTEIAANGEQLAEVEQETCDDIEGSDT